MLPDMKVVVCLRNPLEVAFSLRKRAMSSLAFGLDLWVEYNRRVLDEESRIRVGDYRVVYRIDDGGEEKDEEIDGRIVILVCDR